MRTIATAFLLAVLLIPAGLARGQERDRLADFRAVQEAVHQAIARAEPSIACILVSRSEKYRQYGTAPSDSPGRLGRFDVRTALLGVPPDSPLSDAIRNLDLSNPGTVPESFGSGVVIDGEAGLVLTQAHVVRKAVKIYVRLPGNRGSWADICAADPRSDLAVLRLLDRVRPLQAIKLGDGSKLRKGDFVLSLANPFAAGFRDGSPSASWGIVSNLRRRSTGLLTDAERADRARLTLHHFGTLIQTDTRLSLGCSGGALLNLQGELVGLTTALAGITGGETPGGFAVPLDAGMRRIIDVLRRGEEIEYGFLGVYMQPDGGPDVGVQISRVIEGGPASNAGLRGGDYILAINGVPVRGNDHLFLLINMHLAGSTIRVEASNTPNGPRRTCTAKLAKLFVPDQVIAANRPAARGGLRVDYTSILSQRGRSIPTGVVIREVVPHSPAEKARLQPDMIILSVNNRRVTVPAEFYRAMDNANGPVELTFLNADHREERVTITSK